MLIYIYVDLLNYIIVLVIIFEKINLISVVDGDRVV